MTVRRIVPNIAADNVALPASFYRDILDLDLLMDQGWIRILECDVSSAGPLVSVACEGGSGTVAPDLSVEVDNLAEVHLRCIEHGFAIEYGPIDEP